MKKIQNLLAGDAANLHAFRAALRAALDSNSGSGGFQKSGKKFDEGFIGAVFYGRSSKADFQRAIDGARDFVLAGHVVARGQRKPRCRWPGFR